MDNMVNIQFERGYEAIVCKTGKGPLAKLEIFWHGLEADPPPPTYEMLVSRMDEIQYGVISGKTADWQLANQQLVATRKQATTADKNAVPNPQTLPSVELLADEANSNAVAGASRY